MSLTVFKNTKKDITQLGKQPSIKTRSAYTEEPKVIGSIGKYVIWNVRDNYSQLKDEKLYWNLYGLRNLKTIPLKGDTEFDGILIDEFVKIVNDYTSKIPKNKLITFNKSAGSNLAGKPFNSLFFNGVKEHSIVTQIDWYSEKNKYISANYKKSVEAKWPNEQEKPSKWPSHQGGSANDFTNMDSTYENLFIVLLDPKKEQEENPELEIIKTFNSEYALYNIIDRNMNGIELGEKIKEKYDLLESIPAVNTDKYNNLNLTEVTKAINNYEQVVNYKRQKNTSRLILPSENKYAQILLNRRNIQIKKNWNDAIVKSNISGNYFKETKYINENYNDTNIYLLVKLREPRIIGRIGKYVIWNQIEPTNTLKDEEKLINAEGYKLLEIEPKIYSKTYDNIPVDDFVKIVVNYAENELPESKRHYISETNTLGRPISVFTKDEEGNSMELPENFKYTIGPEYDGKQRYTLAFSTENMYGTMVNGNWPLEKDNFIGFVTNLPYTYDGLEEYTRIGNYFNSLPNERETGDDGSAENAFIVLIDPNYKEPEDSSSSDEEEDSSSSDESSLVNEKHDLSDLKDILDELDETKSEKLSEKQTERVVNVLSKFEDSLIENLEILRELSNKIKN